MFNSTKLSESTRNFKSSPLSFNDETVNDISNSFTLPKITSTPRNSIFATPPKPPVLKSRRYSLSAVATPTRTSRREFIRSNSSYNPGPLLASTKFNINVRTFEDVKSPGLASRIVQYNEEAEREKEQWHPPTHQAKYGTLGLFPIVHLFKKKLPLLERRPRQVTVRVASPDYVKHTPDYNRKLLEGIVKPSGSNQVGLAHTGFIENTTSTRSVLDALKEISRKRIHANEELELRGDNNKRLRTESEDCLDSNKRGRDESPQLETTSPSRPILKKICKYDEYAASRSSMDFLKAAIESTPPPKKKSISISTITDNSKDSKIVKLINAETQTVLEEQLDKEKSEETNEEDKSEKVETVLKVFDDAPLDRIRKNRLAALIGTLVGKDAVLEPKPDYSSLLRDENDSSNTEESTDKPLISILTTNKSPSKSDKHVRFDVSDSISLNNEYSRLDTMNKEQPLTTVKENSEMVAPISVPSVPSYSFGTKSSNISVSESITSTTTSNISPLFSNKSAIESTSSFSTATSAITIPSTVSSPPKAGGFKFDLVQSASTASTPTTKPTFSISSSNTTAPASITTFGSPLSSAGASVYGKTEVKVNAGGELLPDVSSSFISKVSGKPFSFSPPSVTAFNHDGVKDSATTSSSTLFEAISSAGGGFSIVTTSAKTSFSTLTSVANKGLITSPSVTSGTSSGLSAFGAGVTTVNSTFNPPGFGNINTTNIPSFGNAETTINSPYGITNKTLPKYGTVKTTNSPSFGNIIKTAPSSFGNISTTNTSGFGGVSKTTPSFATENTTTTTTFGNINTTNAGTFGKVSTTNSAGFGIGNSPSNAGFGATTSSKTAFGTLTTSNSGFGTAATSGFGSTTTAFGTFPTSSSNIFGTPTTSANVGFGTVSDGTPKTIASSFALPSVNSGFGAATTTNGGFNASTTTAGGGFGTANFGTVSNSSSTFGPTTTSAFGFGTPNTNSVTSFGPPKTTVNTGFGSSSSAFTTNAGSLFGTPNATSFGGALNTPSFGSTNTGTSFGTPTTNSSVFGTSSATTASEGSNKIFGGTTAPFGTPTTGSVFGTTQSPFGTGVTTAASPSLPFTFTGKTIGNTFGTTNTTTASFGVGFGQNTTAFSTQQSSNFGTPNKASVFGNANTSAFGGNTASTGFGTTQQRQQQPFGATGSVFNKAQSPPQNAFGSSSFAFNQQQQQSQPPSNNAGNFGTTTTSQPGIFTFGSGAAEKPGGAFNFSAANAETSKKFDFTSGNTATPSFGTSFGSSATPPVPNFAATPTVAGGFSIGSGPPTSNRPRTMIKGKRRT